MQEADPDAITASFKAWHEGITTLTPAAMATLYATMSTQLRETGNTHNTGAQLLLVNTGGKQLHLISCLLDNPPHQSQEFPLPPHSWQPHTWW